MSETTFDSLPDTADALTLRWAMRDAQYALSRAPMASDMASCIRSARMREANLLPHPSERAAMFMRAQTWEPPVHAEYGSLKDWLE